METVEGLILPFGQIGRTTGGPLTFAAGSVLVPKAIDRVKLMRDHTGQPQHSPVGYALDITQRKDGLYGRFAVADTDDGKAAMKDVRSRIRDAFSVELTDVRKRGSEIVQAHLTAVALVSVPAYHNARVDLAASHTPDRKDTATVTTTTTVHAAQAIDPTTVHAADYGLPHTEGSEADPGPEPQTSTTSDARPDDQPPRAREDDDDGEEGEEGEGTAHASDRSKRTNLVRPSYLSGRSRKPSLSLSQAAAAVLAIQTGGRVDAELADITGTAMGNAEAPGWLGELWEGTAYKRRFAPLVTGRALTNWRVAGWRWVTKPTVDKYAGDKADIPTNTPTIEDFEAVATRWAGGHDLDRKFYDFKETSFLQSYWRAITEDYAKKSDMAVADYIIANAKAVGSATSLWDGMFAAAESLDDALNVTPTFYIGNPADRRALANMTMNTAPAALDLLGVDLKRIQWSSKVPAGTLIAGHSSAVTNAELPGSPIRVEAEHIAKGGRDAALFGYQAIYSENESGLVKVTLGAGGAE